MGPYKTNYINYRRRCDIKAYFASRERRNESTMNKNITVILLFFLLFC